MRFLLVFIFSFVLSGCDDGSSGSVSTGTTSWGSAKAIKSCTGGGTISVYKKSSDGAITLRGSGLKSSWAIQGCPSSVSFTCTGTAVTAAAFGTNLTGNEQYICSGGKATFSPVYNTVLSYATTTTTTTKKSQSSADILVSEVWLMSQGPLEKPSVNGTLQFQITAGRHFPLPCAVQFSCP